MDQETIKQLRLLFAEFDATLARVCTILNRAEARVDSLAALPAGFPPDSRPACRRSLNHRPACAGNTSVQAPGPAENAFTHSRGGSDGWKATSSPPAETSTTPSPFQSNPTNQKPA